MSFDHFFGGLASPLWVGGERTIAQQHQLVIEIEEARRDEQIVVDEEIRRWIGFVLRVITDLVHFLCDEMTERVHVDIIAVVPERLFALLTCEQGAVSVLFPFEEEWTDRSRGNQGRRW